MIDDADLKRGIRAWSNRLHVPVTRMMSRVLREEIHAAHDARLAREAKDPPCSTSPLPPAPSSGSSS